MRAMLITSRRRETHMSRLCAACLCVLLTSLGWGQERTKETFRDVAGRMVKAINAADYEGIRKDFNKEMLKVFPVEKCRTFFSKEVSGKFGKITKLEPPQLKSATEAIFAGRAGAAGLRFQISGVLPLRADATRLSSLTGLGGFFRPIRLGRLCRMVRLGE